MVIDAREAEIFERPGARTPRISWSLAPSSVSTLAARHLLEQILELFV